MSAAEHYIYGENYFTKGRFKWQGIYVCTFFPFYFVHFSIFLPPRDFIEKRTFSIVFHMFFVCFNRLDPGGGLGQAAGPRPDQLPRSWVTVPVGGGGRAD